MKRYLFLDIDGVCNHSKWYYQNRIVNHKDCDDADPACIERLNQLADLDVKIVISSSWGEDADPLLMRNGLKLPIVGHTPKLWNYNWACRGNEIAKWIDENIYAEHIDDTFEYVIFDDDTDMLMSQSDNYVHINPDIGIQQSDINKARKIFK